MQENTSYTFKHLQALRNKREPLYIWKEIDYDFPIQDNNIEEHYRITDDWLQRLKILRCVYTKSQGINKSNIKEFTQFLISNQRKNTKNSTSNVEGSWAIPEEVDMESDARVEFIYFPTYIATAFLCLVKQILPSIANKCPKFDDVLKKGLKFCSNRNLQGHGFESVQESLTAIEYLSLGKVFTFINENPNVSPKFNKAKREAKKAINNRLKNNTGWVTIDEERAQLSLRYLEGLDSINELVCESKLTYWKTKEKEIIINELVEEALLTAASDFLPEIQNEIMTRCKLLAEIGKNIRPKYQVFKNVSTIERSEAIKLNSDFNLTKTLSELKDNHKDLNQVVAYINSREFIDELVKNINRDFHRYFDRRDIAYEYFRDKKIEIRVCKTEIENMDINIYIEISAYHKDYKYV